MLPGWASRKVKDDRKTWIRGLSLKSLAMKCTNKLNRGVGVGTWDRGTEYNNMINSCPMSAGYWFQVQL